MHCKHEYECTGNYVLTCMPPISGTRYTCHKCGYQRSVEHPRSFAKPSYLSDADIDNKIGNVPAGPEPVSDREIKK